MLQNLICEHSFTHNSIDHLFSYYKTTAFSLYIQVYIVAGREKPHMYIWSLNMY